MTLLGLRGVAVLTLLALGAALFVGVPGPPAAGALPEIVREYPVPRGARPHDVAPARDGGVWYTAQGSGDLGHLDPATGRTRQISLGERSAPHGVIVGHEKICIRRV